MIVIQLPPTTAKSLAAAPVIWVERLNRFTGALLVSLSISAREFPAVVALKAAVPEGMVEK